MNKKLKDAVYGFAVGDALGVPYEFLRRGTFRCTDMIGHGTWNQDKGTFSDDTSMVLATCDALKNGGILMCKEMTVKDNIVLQSHLNIRKIANNFIRWYRNAEYSCAGTVFDIGNTTAEALHNYEKSGNPFTCGYSDEYNNGNGGLMRILPLAFVPNVRPMDIKDVCSITHGHELSVTACYIYVECIRSMLEHWEMDMPWYWAQEYGQYFPRIWNIRNLKEGDILSTGYVLHTLEAALWCFYTTDNYVDCVLKAVNLGGDTDTIAALAGGLAGCKYGFDAIPNRWISTLRNRKLINDCLF